MTAITLVGMGGLETAIKYKVDNDEPLELVLQRAKNGEQIEVHDPFGEAGFVDPTKAWAVFVTEN